ncbi:MAG: efflux RND transporter periplasmic adaptor subunit [Planctomycetia bacterium]|nr:efflux RND transporter periplasmic adaptor subunit [Planctomycetia bacterium]
MRRTAAAVAGLAVLVVCLTAANLRRDPGAVELDWQLVRPPAREVVLEPPGRGAIVQTINAPGKVESVEEAEIASQLVGRVVAVNVREGDAVKKGDVLVRLDSTDARARLDSSSARIDRLRSAIDQAEKDLEKVNRDATQSGKLASRGFNTPTELADARTAVAKAQGALRMSRHELVESEATRRTFEQDLQRTEIRSPIDGVVSGLNVEVGEVVIAGTTNLPGALLMTVSDLTRMRVRADVDETDIPLVRPGQPAQVFLQSDPLHPVAGSVDLIAPKGKPKDDVVNFETLIRIAPGDHPGLRPGMSATVEVEVRRAADALGVPAQAVVHRRRKDLPDTPAVRDWAARNARSPGEKAQEAELRYVKIVFVEDRGVARARPVETGLSDERRVEILAGLKPDDKVIVGPFRALDELKDGNAVTPLKAGADGVASSGR